MVVTREATNLSLNRDYKKEARELYKKLGFSLSDAVNAFLAQSIEKKGFPFELRLPNPETKQAIDEAEKKVGLEKATIEELLDAVRPIKARR